MDKDSLSRVATTVSNIPTTDWSRENAMSPGSTKLPPIHFSPESIADVKDMSAVFKQADFKSKKSDWDLSNVEVDTSQFAAIETPEEPASFDKDIRHWKVPASTQAVLEDVDVSGVKSDPAMFAPTPFDVDTTAWDKSRIEAEEKRIKRELDSTYSSDVPSSPTP